MATSMKKCITNKTVMHLFILVIFDVCLFSSNFSNAQNIVHRNIKNYTEVNGIPLITTRKIIKDNF